MAASEVQLRDYNNPVKPLKSVHSTPRLLRRMPLYSLREAAFSQLSPAKFGPGRE